MNKSILTTLVSVATIASAIFTQAAKINEGMTFYDEGNGADKKEKNTSIQKNIDGISFDIAEKKSPKEIDWVKRAKRGSRGNVTCYVDKDGVPTAVFVIGVASVPRTMIAVDAKEQARHEAEMNAKEAFALWLHEFVTVENTREKKTLIVRTNGEEQSQTEIKESRIFTQVASASWRGMSLFGDALEKGEYISVWRWSVQEQQMAQMVELLTQDQDHNKGSRRANWEVEERKFSFRDED